MKLPEEPLLRARSSFILHPSSFAPRRAFTLTEILIVIGIIVLVLAMAVPAFNYMTGARSIASAENLVSAMLARARHIAIEEQRQAGVVFFYNPRTQRSTMAITIQRPSSEPIVEDPYHNYKGWTEFVAINQRTPYREGHEVIARYLHPTAGPGGTPKWIVQRFVCIQPHDAAASNRPPNPSFWAISDDVVVDFLPGDEFQTLPVGVGLQLINDPGSSPQVDRYVRTGVVLFDKRGLMISRPFRILQNTATQASLIGEVLELQSDLAIPRSQLGVILYDRQMMINAARLETGETFQASENDWIFEGQMPRMSDPPTWNDEAREELWLDRNTTPLLVNRYNGTLIKGE